MFPSHDRGGEALDGSEKYLDGAFVTSNPTSEASGFVNLHANFEVGGSADFATSPINGVIDEVRFRIGLLSQSFIATEYANQSDPAAFYGTPTLATTGGATGVTADVSYTVNAPTFSSTASVTLPSPIADAAFAVNAPTFAASASATIPGFNASVDFAIASPTFSASASVTLPNPAGDVSYTVSAPTFNVSANASLLAPIVTGKH